MTARPLRDSAPRHPWGARSLGPVPPRKRLKLTIVLRPDPLASHDPARRKAARAGELIPHRRPRLAAREFDRLHRAPAHALEQVVAFARQHRFRVLEVDPVRRDVVLQGTARAVRAAFGVRLHTYHHRGRRYRSHAGRVHLPRDLKPLVEAILGLDQAPVVRRWGGVGHQQPGRRFSPQEVARYYQFPPRASGRGQRIAVLSFDGGYHERDLRTYFQTLAGTSAPRVRSLSIADAANRPLPMRDLSKIVGLLNTPGVRQRDLEARCDPGVLGRGIATMEATMDVELAGALAPGAAIDVFHAPNDAWGFRAAILAALGLHPVRTKSGRARWVTPADVISISWGCAESLWEPRGMWSVHWALKKAQHLGVTVCCASGDFGSRCTGPGEGGRARLAKVSFPASSPYALACGGTTLGADGELVWNTKALGVRVSSGGGVSGFFHRPDHQRGVAIPVPGAPRSGIWINQKIRHQRAFRGRGVPDVAANADARTGYRILVGGRETAGWGTSAAAPVWAALLARIGERLKTPVGWVNALLYRRFLRRALRPVVRGNNDVARGRVRFFRGRRGWNPCDGWGSPVGTRLAALLGRGRRS